MMKSSMTNFWEKGYGQFPYIIIRWNDFVFQQIPIHRVELKPLGYEGIFIPEAYQCTFVDYAESCFSYSSLFGRTGGERALNWKCASS